MRNAQIYTVILQNAIFCLLLFASAVSKKLAIELAITRFFQNNSRKNQIIQNITFYKDNGYSLKR